MSRKLTTNDFIKRAKGIHGNKYDYSKVKYKNSSTKVTLICPKHGKFEQRPNGHLAGYGCFNCGLEKTVNFNKSTTNDFIKKAKDIHGNKYDYSKVEYKGNKIKTFIECSKHGIFKMKPNCHLNGYGCPRCSGRGKTTDDFIHEAKKIHNDEFDYSKVEYVSTYKKIIIICKKHGEFKQTPNQHLNGGRCPKCSESNGEKNVRLFLENNKIKFETQKRFKGCIDKRPLPFDFYLPNYNLCIEFQGKQHFQPINYFGGNKKFKELIKRDLIKKKYCENNNIKLITIRFDENINKKLKIISNAC